MTEIAIIGAKPIHVGMIARRLRAEDEAEIRAVYGDPRKAIRRFYHASPVRRAAFVDGEIAALWGCDGTLLSTEGHAWLVTTPAIEKAPLRFLRETRRELREMLQSRQVLRSHAAAGYARALRFMRLAGFAVGEPQSLGRNGELFCELRMEA